MKKKILVIVLFIMLLFPITAFASTCTSTGISGQASSYATGSSGSGCTWVCWWDESIGLRFRIYSYDGKTYKPLGRGVDVWGFSGASRVYMSNARYSNPDNNAISLKNNGSCATAQTTGMMNLTSEQYDDHPIYIDASLKGNFTSGTVNDFILNSSKNNGWLYNNLYSKLKANNSTADTEFKNLWGVEARTVRNDADNIYIVVEVLVKVYTKNSSISGFQNGNFYFGTVSEFAPTLGFSSTYRALGIRNVPVGKMVNGLINQVDVGGINSVFQAYGAGENINRLAACNNAYGMAIYHLSTDCEECGKPTCEQDCSMYTKGTYEHQLCARGWCNQNAENGKTSECISACTNIPEDEGCPKISGKSGSGANTCYTYLENGVETTAKSVGNRCPDPGLDGNANKTLKTKVCYDDATKYEIVDDSGKTTTDGGYSLSGTKYYKIECNEKVELSELPTKREVLVSQSGTSSLYLGYKMLYDKSCQLYFKATTDGKTTNGWVKEQDATSPKSYTSGSSACKPQDSSKKMLKIDYDLCAARKAKSEATNKKNAAKTDEEKKTYDSIISVSDQAITQLSNVKSNAKARLKNVSMQDYKDSSHKFETQAEIEVLSEDKTSTKTETLTLEPVSCMDGNDTTVTRCDLNNNKSITISTGNTVICGDENNQKKATIENGSSHYSKTTYYALPSMWINAQVTDAGKAFKTKEACEKSGAAGEEALCVKKDNVWVFNPLDESISHTTNAYITKEKSFSIKLKNYGSCGQFEYESLCDYSLKDSSTTCLACTNYEYGTDAYEACYQKNCSCESYCGSNVACRSKYCPSNCEGCGWREEDDCPGNECKTNCQVIAGSTSNEKYITCIYDDCCAASCKGEEGCVYDCCARSCNEKAERLGWTQDKYKACMTECKCPNGSCGEDYLYRTITMNDPFPGRESGKNWYNKVEYITKSEESLTKYADKTDGKTDDYEYKVTITNDDIKGIKNKMNTTYEVFKKSDKAKSKIGPNVYCSSMLHDYLKNGQVEFGRFGSGSGCGIR